MVGLRGALCLYGLLGRRVRLGSAGMFVGLMG